MRIKFLRNHMIGIKVYKSGDEVEVLDATGHKLILRNFALNADSSGLSAPSKEVMKEVLDEENGKDE